MLNLVYSKNVILNKNIAFYLQTYCLLNFPLFSSTVTLGGINAIPDDIC